MRALYKVAAALYMRCFCIIRTAYRQKAIHATRHTLWMCLGFFIHTNAAFTHSFSPYTNQELDELEKQFVEHINQSSQVERSPLAVQYLNAIGQKIATHGRMKAPHFFIVKSPEINAFAGPGGHIGINTGLILATQNESELAGVMAHEMAHVRLHHLYRMFEHEKQMRIPMLASILASLALGILNPAVGGGAMLASLGGFAQDNINYIRSNEKEADRDGIAMLKKAGFNPQGMADFFKKMQQSARYYYTENLPAILRTHPLDEDRIAEAENRIHSGGKKHYQASSSDYYLVKELIRNRSASPYKNLMDFYKYNCSKDSPDYACFYGKSLTLIQHRQYLAAKKLLDSLLKQQPDNLFYILAMAQVELAANEVKESVKRLAAHYDKSPGNYALLMAYGKTLTQGKQYNAASFVYLKGSRLFPKDLVICRQLARAQAQDHHKAYAYFTHGQCLLLQGKTKDALYQLKQAKNYEKSDGYIHARIDAKIEELKQD